MFKKHRKKISFGVVCLFLVMIFLSAVSVNLAIAGSRDGDDKKSSFIHSFSDPVIEKDGNYLRITIDEADSVTSLQGSPMLPVVTRTVEFDWGTKIKSVNFTHSEVETKSIKGLVKQVPFFRFIGNMVVQEYDYSTFSESDGVFPTVWYKAEKGAGINKDGERVLFLSIHIYPVRYNPPENILQYIDSANIDIYYEEEEIEISSSNVETYDMIIISPSYFSSNLQPLIEHKNNHGLLTTHMSVEDIYDSYPGRDKQEKIKYFVKYALEEWNIKYVFIIGDIEKVPIRTTQAFPWEMEDDLLSDLYYTDIYDENYSFCTWDGNENDIFGEVLFDFHEWPPEITDLDDVDLYPDLIIGRIPCRNKNEVDSHVEKIINYEETTYDQNWFKEIVLAGGDTFPPRRLSPFNIFEGEITNAKVAQQLPDFEHTFLWSSKRDLHPWTFNRAINKGAGFVSYAGHGFEHGWGTYRPNSLSKQMIFYFTPFIQGLRNQHKLPIIFFDACLTAKLDFNMSDLDKYFPIAVRLIQIFTGVNYNPLNYFPVFGYAIMNKENGGAIGVIGATRSAYTFVDSNGVYAGAGYLDVHFFKAYEEGITFGEMLTSSQNDYINNVGKDYFTIEEYLILGDPSLRVGGYP